MVQKIGCRYLQEPSKQIPNRLPGSELFLTSSGSRRNPLFPLSRRPTAQMNASLRTGPQLLRAVLLAGAGAARRTARAARSLSSAGRRTGAGDAEIREHALLPARLREVCAGVEARS